MTNMKYYPEIIRSHRMPQIIDEESPKGRPGEVELKTWMRIKRGGIWYDQLFLENACFSTIGDIGKAYATAYSNIAFNTHIANYLGKIDPSIEFDGRKLWPVSDKQNHERDRLKETYDSRV